MDKPQLITIVVTAAVTTTVTLIISSLFSLAKSTALADATKQTAKKILSRNNLRIIRDVFFLVLSVFVFVENIRSKAPINRWDVVFIGITMFGIVVWTLFLAFDIARITYFLKYDHKTLEEDDPQK